MPAKFIGDQIIHSDNYVRSAQDANKHSGLRLLGCQYCTPVLRPDRLHRGAVPAWGGEQPFHALDWSSGKQTRVSFSSVGAEMLAAVTSADRGGLLAERFQSVYNSNVKLPLVLCIDSFGLCTTINTLHEGSDYRLRPTVSRLRDAYETGEIEVMQWIPGKDNLADGLTKRNIQSQKNLNKTMTSGLLYAKVFERARRTSFG